MQRTTTAVTIFNSGMKDNVLPPYAEFVVNHRIHSSQSCDEVFFVIFRFKINFILSFDILLIDT
jgi:carboxypeptidase PM20D1